MRRLCAKLQGIAAPTRPLQRLLFAIMKSTPMDTHSQATYGVFSRKLWLAAGFIILLSGCASMSPEECRTADWREKGVRDGQNGQPRAYIEEHREACAKVGIVPNAALWEQGRAEGVLRYCTPENALEVGRRGSGYRNACPPELEGAFLERYRAGRKVYDAQQRVERLTNEQRSKQNELDRAKDDKARDRIRNQLRDLDYRLRGARDDLYYEERRLYR